MFDAEVSELIDQLGKLPGVGPKSAQRIALFVLQNPAFDPIPLANTLNSIREKVTFCVLCGMLATESQCVVCRDPRRDESILCVVEEAKDVWAIERTKEYRGRYHVLGGALSPLDGVGPEQLRIRSLMSRVRAGGISEVIIATDPNLEGEATASYLSRALSDTGVSVTRLASGLPVGGDLEYADEVTLSRAFAGRRSF